MEPIKRLVFSDGDRQAVHDAVVAAVEADPKPFLAAYKRNPETFGGRYVCADSFKDTFEQFRATRESRNRYNGPVHNAAAVLSAEQYRRALRDDMDPARESAIFLTGVPGAGKTTAVVSDGFPENCRVIFEGQMSRPEPSIEKIQQAIDAGLKPAIVVVHVEPELALQRTFRRFDEYGRGASIQVMAEIQSKLPEGLKTIHDQFGETVSLTIHDNRKPGQHRALQGWEHLNLLSKEGNHDHITQRLTAELDRQYGAGKITDACYRQAKGASPIGPGMVGQSDPKNQRNSVERGFTQGNSEAHEVGAAARHPRARAFEQLSHEDAVKAHPELTGAVRELANKTAAIIQAGAGGAQWQAEAVATVRADIQGRLDAGRIPPLPPVQAQLAPQVERDR